MDSLLHLVQNINSCLSNYVLVILLASVGIFYSIKTRFVQIRCFKEGFQKLLGNMCFFGEKHKSGMSSFQALATAIAAQVGTGNIVGASGAILIGGPGAIFWMWLVAFFGMATIYAEAILAQKTRVVAEDGNIHGGPVYYIKRAFPNWFGSALAGLFAVATIIAMGFIGAMIPANAIGATCLRAFHIPTPIVGIILVGIAALIIIGGIQRLASVMEKLVPIMALLYILGGIVVLILRVQYIPATFACIFKYAFTPSALLGGGIGAALKIAISQGVKRGLFSNEAGMGSTPHAHALANVKDPHDQGVVAMISVFIDTFLVLNVTALIVISVLYVGDGPLANANGANYKDLLLNAGLTQNTLTQSALAKVWHSPTLGNIFVATCLFFFAFTTILGWNLFGKINFQFLFPGKKATLIYLILSLCFIFLGTMIQSDLCWELSDLFNQLMVLPNVIALFALARLVTGRPR